MRRRTVGTVVAAAVLASLGLLAAPGAGGAAETITAYLGDSKMKVADVGREGPSPGDDLLFRGVLFVDETRSVPLGSARSVCEQLDRNHVYCWHEVTIDGRGDFASAGTQDFRTSTVVDSIVGGTGDFVGATGTVTVDFSTGTVTIAIA